MSRSEQAPSAGVESLLEAAALPLAESRAAVLDEAQRELARSSREVARVVAAHPATTPIVGYAGAHDGC